MAISNSKNLISQVLTEDPADLQEEGGKLFEFQTLVENTKVMMLILQDQQICYANSISKVLTGYSKEELLVNTDLVFQLQLDQKRQHSEPTDSLCPSAERDCAVIQERQVKLLTKNGRSCWLDCSIQIVKFAKKPAFFITAVDITRHKEAEQKIEKILKQEKKLVSMVSHELRTPLNIISFSSRLLSRYGDSWKPSKVQEYLKRLQRGVDTLSLLIDEWLILGKVDTGKIKFEPKEINIEQFCRNLISDLQLGAENQQQINFLSLGDCTSVNVDHRILQLILTNLLENALKYSPEGNEVDFIVSYNSKQLTFKIQDQGIGIKQSDLHQLFDPFYRGENVDNIPGHGLGLAIVKKLVGIHGGQITIDSKLGVGTEFVIALPN